MTSNVAHLVAKPITVGAAAFAWSRYQTTAGVNDMITLFGTRVSIPLATAAAVTIGSLAAEVAHTWVFPTIEPVGKMWASPAAEAFAVGTSTAVQAAVYTVGNKSAVADLGLMSIATTALIAEVIGSFTFDKFVAPLIFSEDVGY